MRTLTPNFTFEPRLRPAFPDAINSGLHSLHRARAGDLLGICLGHGVGAKYSGGSVTEYLSVILANGDGRTCDGAVFAMKAEAHAIVDVIETGWISSHAPAQSYLACLEKSRGRCETIHFRTFTVLAQLGDETAPYEDHISGLRVLLHGEPTVREITLAIAQLKALFAFWHDLSPLFGPYHLDLPTPEKVIQCLPNGN